MKAHLAKFRYWFAILIKFGSYQGLVQLFIALAGLLIIRALSKQDYALYAIANGMQSSCSLLADIGIGIGVSSIGGRVWNEHKRFGELLNTALDLRRRLATISIAVCVPVAAWMLLKNGSSMFYVALLCIVMVAAVIPQLGASIWQISPQLHGQFRRLQNLDLGGAVLRIALVGIMAITSINAVLASSVNVMGNWLRMVYLRRWAHEKADPSASLNGDDRRELLRLVYKSLPNMIFFCFQGQVTLLILSFLGNTLGIADLTALGRLTALLAVFSTTFANVIAPRFARTTGKRRLAWLYGFFTGGTALYLAPFVWFAWVYPNAFLFLLGGKYSTLGPETGWVMLTAAFAQVAGLLWTLNCWKAWIRVQSLAYIPTILIVQIMIAFCVDLRNLHGVILFNLATTLAPLPVYLADAWLGLREDHSLSGQITVSS